MKPAIGTVLIRVEGFSPTFEFLTQTGVEVPYTVECTVVKHTPKGVWLKRPYSNKLKFQLDEGGRYAAPDLAQAMNAFHHRRIRYIQILENNLEHAKQELQSAITWKEAQK